MFCSKLSSCEKASSWVNLHLPAISFLARQSFFVPLSGFFLFLKTAKRKLLKKNITHTHTGFTYGNHTHFVALSYQAGSSDGKMKTNQLRGCFFPLPLYPSTHESAFVKTPKEERKPYLLLPQRKDFSFSLPLSPFRPLEKKPGWRSWPASGQTGRVDRDW